MFYENVNIMIFKVLGSVVYCMDNYLCADYLCLQKVKLYLANKGFKNTKFNDITGIDIPELK